MMSVQHRELAQGRWGQLSLVEQMAHIGSEVSRALNWRNKKDEAHSRSAFIRALELVDMTLDNVKGFPRLKEVARLREALVDYFDGKNEFSSTETLWRKYFDHFAFCANRMK